VHGLTGNRETTWTHKNGIFWPRQLAEDIKRTRIMTFGYDADPVKLWGMAGGNNLRNHGKNLAFAVSDRRRGCRQRPIIFIAHSLGGLVCEQALLYCREGEQNLEKVFQSTRGIIFMGTPHAGADLASWGYTLAKFLNVVRRTNSAILEPLRQKSDVLIAVQQQFQQLLLKPGVNLKIHCFFEEKAVVGVGVIVPEFSAALGQYPNQSIAANHMDMTKFCGRDDGGYQAVLGRLYDNIEWINSLIPMETSEQPSGGTGQNPTQLQNRIPQTSGAAEHDFGTNQTVSSTGSGVALGIGQQNVQGNFHIR
jgi:protein SERAC1